MGTTEIAVLATVLFMAFAALASISSNKGYAFDLRAKKTRRKAARSGGRRAEDAVLG